MDQEEFVGFYFPLLTRRFAGRGIAPEELIRTIWKGVGAMAAHDGSRTNEAVFWDCFERCLSVKRKDVEAELLDFYSDEFNKAIRTTRPTPLADEIIRRLKAKSIKCYLATNPIFPRCATMNRIRWAGLGAEDFEIITTYENSHSSKPNVLYFKEILAKCGLEPAECLMVGNDVEEDLAARKLGIKTYLVTDCLENKKKLPIETDYSGTLEEFAYFTDSGNLF